MKKDSAWKKILAPLLAGIALAIAVLPDVLQGWQVAEREAQNGGATLQQPAASRDNGALYAAMDNKRSGVMVAGEGVVQKVLKDDTDGSRHQRFILDVGQGRTLLVAHNIDLAPRVPDLQAGGTVRFYGQYESNHRDGVLHWTHRDPAGRHAHGWLEYRGKRYE